MNNMEELHKGLIQEGREHKEFSKEIIRKLVEDHLKIDPEYYLHEEEGDEKNMYKDKEEGETKAHEKTESKAFEKKEDEGKATDAADKKEKKYYIKNKNGKKVVVKK